MRVPGERGCGSSSRPRWATTRPRRSTTAIGFTVTDGKGKVVSTGFREATMAPNQPGEPGPLETTSVADVEPGAYTLKLAVVDCARAARQRRASVYGRPDARRPP